MVEQQFGLWAASDLPRPSTTGKWLELLQKWWRIPSRGCIAAKTGVNCCLCSIYDKVKLCIWHLLAGAEGLWSGRVDCARLLPSKGRQTANVCLSTWSHKVAWRLSSLRTLAPLSVIWRKRASDKRQIFQNAKALAQTKHTIVLFLCSFVAWLLRFKNEVGAL